MKKIFLILSYQTSQFVATQRLKYCLSIVFILPLAVAVQSQTNLVTIIGDAPTGNEDIHDFINSNPQVEHNEPQIQQQISAQNIEPTLENGFHIRFELNQASQENNFPDAPSVSSGLMSTSSSSGGGSSASSGRARRHAPSLEERSFNTKKKMKRWLPKRKKRYHPHLCGRF